MLNVGILGATGIVGQQLISLLLNHPWFHIRSLAASPQNVGKKYGDICNIHPSVNNIIIKPPIPTFFSECHIIFSCLHSNVSSQIEKTFLDYDFLIFSNCHNYRLHPLVPLVVPTVNYYNLIKPQLYKHLRIIPNANCSTTGLVTILKPLDLQFNIENVIVTTLQAISGAGKYFDQSIDNNIIPFIKNEEEKINNETPKILDNYDFSISATCNRVPVSNGHTICMSIKFKNKPTPKDVIKCLNLYNLQLKQQLLTPTSSNINFINILTDENRPQPILDTNSDNGFCVTVGRIRECNIFDIKLTIHFNNIVLGAAGSTILNAEIYSKYNLL